LPAAAQPRRATHRERAPAAPPPRRARRTSTSAATTSKSSSATTTSETSESTESDTTEFSISESEIAEAYVGTDEAGEAVYWICNADGSKAGLFIITSSGDYVSFLGPTEVDGNIITVTDAVTGNACAIGVSTNDDGSIAVTGSVATTDGATADFNTTFVPCDISQAFSILQGVSEYANMIA
jgi:hypothetical protein